MGKWLELAARLEAESTGDNRDDRDVSPAFRPIVPNVPNVPASLPPSIVAGLKKLRSMAAPKLRRPEVWPGVVSDAVRLARDGWAAKALALGWLPLDLFGAVVDPDGDPFADGLAVKLGGRPIIAMCASFATVDDGSGGRVFLHCATGEDVRLLWELGR